LHNIFNADDLIKFLQKQKAASGISIRELKDGWLDVFPTIDRLEMEHKLLVTRNKSDNQARMVWLDDATLHAPIDQEYKDIWDKIPVPEKPDNIIKELILAGLKSAGTVTKPKPRTEEKKKKKARRGQKTTNTHMLGLFKDYSSFNPKAIGETR